MRSSRVAIPTPSGISAATWKATYPSSVFSFRMQKARAGFAAQVLDLVRGRGPDRIASQSLLPRLEKVFRPAIIKVLDDPLAAAELGDTVLAAQPFQYNADLVFRREVSPR